MLKYLRWRWDMALHWRHVLQYAQDAAAMVEVGTWQGASARRWLEQGRVQQLACVDPYTAKHDGSWESTQTACDAARRVAKQALQSFVDEGRLTWIHENSLTAATKFPDEALDAVYVDADHCLEAVRADLRAWWPKLRPGGVLIGDDHLQGRWWGCDVLQAVDEFRPVDEARREFHGRWFVIVKEAA